MHFVKLAISWRRNSSVETIVMELYTFFYYHFPEAAFLFSDKPAVSKADCLYTEPSVLLHKEQTRLYVWNDFIKYFSILTREALLRSCHSSR